MKGFRWWCSGKACNCSVDATFRSPDVYQGKHIPPKILLLNLTTSASLRMSPPPLLVMSVFTKKHFLALAAVLAVFGCASTSVNAQVPGVKTTTQTANKPSKPDAGKYKYGYNVSVTTGWRPIETGFEKSVLNKDPNLKNWAWVGMQEMNKDYKRLRPGQIGHPRPSHYRKPAHISTPAHPVKVVHTAPPPMESRYTRPTRVPLPTRSSVATSARLSAPSTQISLSAPKTNARLAVPSTSARLAVPSTSIKLSAPSTNARLASKQTQARLTVPARPTAPARPMPTDAMSDTGEGGADNDTFESPELQERDAYGPRTHRTYGYSKTSANVRAKLVKKKH